MRFMLAGLWLVTGGLWAAEVAPSLSPIQETALSGYQGWSEPVVRDWRETNRLVSAESANPADNQGMEMPMPAETAPSRPTPATPHHSMSMPGMHHGGM